MQCKVCSCVLPQRRWHTFSSTSGSKFPMNRLAPTSRVSLSCDALFTRMALPKSLIMFSTLIACIVHVTLPQTTHGVASQGMFTGVHAVHSLAADEERFRLHTVCANLEQVGSVQSCKGSWTTHIVCIFLSPVLHKSILLMHVCYTILGQVDIDCRGIRGDVKTTVCSDHSSRPLQVPTYLQVQLAQTAPTQVPRTSATTMR